jgi:hypothetical protein
MVFTRAARSSRIYQIIIPLIAIAVVLTTTAL